jgi:hypothetical protein
LENAASVGERSNSRSPHILKSLVQFAARPALTLFFLALAVRLIQLGRSPLRDELFHVLAARSLLADGDLIIDGDRPYTRGALFTYLVAGLFRLFGESLVVARLPGVLAGAALTVVLFLWVRAKVDARAAWAAALLVCFDSVGLLLSQLGRFYGLHALLFFLGAIALYGAFVPDLERQRAIALIVLAFGALYLALGLQLTTAIGIVGLLIWLGLARGPTVWRWLARAHGRRWIGAGIVAAALIVVIAGWETLSTMWDRYQWADDWAAGRSGDLLYYHRLLVSIYPPLWSLFPVIVGIALAATWGVAGFCTLVFATSVVLLSVGAMKAERYLFFVMPFFFILSGIAIGGAIPWLLKGARSVLARWKALRARPRLAASLAAAALVSAALFAMGSTRGLVRTAQMLGNRQALETTFGWQPNWNDAAAELLPLADSSAMVLSSWPLASWYYLDRLDVSLHAPDLTPRNQERLPEFAIPSWYLPRPTISEAESLARLLACAPSGLAIIERTHWRNPWQVSDELADFIERHLARVEVPERWGLLVFRWQGGTGDLGDGTDCPAPLREPTSSASGPAAPSASVRAGGYHRLAGPT